MSKDRLEEIKNAWHFYGDITDFQFRWLTEQVERMQELEELIDKADEHAVRNGKEIMRLTDEKAELDYQNKRYRSIIEDILNHADEYNIPQLEQVMIRQSLRGDTHA